MTAGASGPEMFALLRDKLLSGDLGAITAGATSEAGATADDVFGVVMELGVAGGTALVFGLRDGSASLYLSTGGGSIGGQGRPRINAAAKNLVETARGFVARLSPVDEHPLPAEGRVRFSIFTPSGVRAVEAAERELVSGKSDLVPLFRGAHEILTAFRLSEERGRPNEPLYVNCLLTALARGHAASVVLTAGEPPPDPATLTDDAQDLEWFASLGPSPAAQSTEKVIHLVLEAAGFRRFHLRKKEGHLRTALTAHDGNSATDFDFRVTKRTQGGRLQVELVPLRG